MNPRFRLWAGEITTIFGSSAFLGAGVSMLTHAVPWQIGVPAMVGAAVLALMPENHVTASVIQQDAADLTQLGLSLGHGSQSVQAVSAMLPALANDVQATFALMGSAHANTPAGGTTVSQVTGGVATTTTTLPLPGAAVESATTVAKTPAGTVVATETASSPAPVPAPAASPVAAAPVVPVPVLAVGATPAIA